MHKLYYDFNNNACNGTCPICHDRTEPVVPMDAFLKGTSDVVCIPCSHKYEFDQTGERSMLEVGALAADWIKHNEPLSYKAEDKMKIYCFVDGVITPTNLLVVALAADGYLCTNHISSNEEWAKTDIKNSLDRKTVALEKKFPQGYFTEWIDKPREHPGVEYAYLRVYSE